MLSCAMCGKPLKECCDLFYEATDEEGNDVVVCGDCVVEHNIEMEDEPQAEKEDPKNIT